MSLRVQYSQWPRPVPVRQEPDELNFSAPPAEFGLDEVYYCQPHRTFMPQASIWYGDQSDGGIPILSGTVVVEEMYWVTPTITRLPTFSFVYQDRDEQGGVPSSISVDEESWRNPGVTLLPTAQMVVTDADQLMFTFAAGPARFRKTLSEGGTGIGKRQKHRGEIGDTRGTL